ncbi:MAG TPA: hypothetical protein VGM94_15165 [Galbitalea sp.]
MARTTRTGPRARPGALVTVVTVVVAALAVVALAGCTSAVVKPHPAASSPSPASPHSPARPATPPDSRVALGCSDLLSSADLGHLFTDRMQAVNPAGPQLDAGSGIPATYYEQTAGGVDCAWSNGKANNGSAAIAAMTATMTVLPNATADWAKYRAKYHLPSNRQAFCSGDTSTAACFLQSLVNGYWVTADYENVDVKLASSTSPVVGAVKPVLAAAEARLASLPPSEPSAGAAPGASAGLPANCAGYLTPAEVKKALGTTATMAFGGSGDNWSVSAAAEQRSGVPFCSLSPAGSEDSYGYVAVLPAGAWAAADAVTLTGAKRLAVTGLGTDDSATAYVNPTTNAVIVDLVLNGNWIEVDVVKLDATAAIPAASVAPATSAIRIARDIVSRIG